MFKGKLPKFASNKIVGAMKITKLIREMDKTATMKLEKGKKFIVPAHVMIAKNPKLGMYYVQYADGTIGFQDAKQFEAGYSELKKTTNPSSPPPPTNKKEEKETPEKETPKKEEPKK